MPSKYCVLGARANPVGSGKLAESRGEERENLYRSVYLNFEFWSTFLCAKQHAKVSDRASH